MKKLKPITHIVDEQNLYSSYILADQPIKFWWLIFLGLVIGFINGFWGGGGGMVCVPTLTNIVGLPEKRAHATAIFIMLPLCIISLIVYAISKAMNWYVTLKVGIGFVIGGAIGALVLKKINNVVLNIMFAVVIIVGGIKLLL